MKGSLERINEGGTRKRITNQCESGTSLGLRCLGEEGEDRLWEAKEICKHGLWRAPAQSGKARGRVDAHQGAVDSKHELHSASGQCQVSTAIKNVRRKGADG